MIYTFTANPSLDKLYVLNKLSIGLYNRGQVVQYDTGGKGINVSRCLKELGEKSTIIGYFGGSTGNSLLEKLTSQGYEVDPIHIKEYGSYDSPSFMTTKHSRIYKHWVIYHIVQYLIIEHFIR